MSFIRFSGIVASAVGAMILFFGPASAQGLFNTQPARGGIYISGYGGISFGGDAEFVGVQNPEAGVPGAAGAPAVADVDFSSSRAFGGALGVQLPFKYWKIFHPRLEIEAGTFRQNVDGGSFNGGTQTFLGELSATTILINNYSDIIFSEDQVIVPYIGGGIGVAFVDSNVLYFPGSASAPTFGVIGEDTALFGTIAAGVSFRFSENIELYSEARYNRITDANLERRFVSGGADGFSAEVDDNLSNVSVLGGVRFRF